MIPIFRCCNTIQNAVKFSVANELLGIVAHTEDLLRDISQVNLAKDNGLILFCWGDDNNCKDTIKFLKDKGLHAIIYDKVDVLIESKVTYRVYDLKPMNLGLNFSSEKLAIIAFNIATLLMTSTERTEKMLELILFLYTFCKQLVACSLSLASRLLDAAWVNHGTLKFFHKTLLFDWSRSFSSISRL